MPTYATRLLGNARLKLESPASPPSPGRPAPQFRVDEVTNASRALVALGDAQDNMTSAWLNHYATRMRLYLDMGAMKIADDGRWIQEPLF